MEYSKTQKFTHLVRANCFCTDLRSMFYQIPSIVYSEFKGKELQFFSVIVKDFWRWNCGAFKSADIPDKVLPKISESTEFFHQGNRIIDSWSTLKVEYNSLKSWPITLLMAKNKTNTIIPKHEIYRA